MRLLEVRNLQMHYNTAAGEVKAVDGVSFGVDKNQALGIVGESGCGKTSIGISILRLLPENGRISAGEVVLNGRNLISLTEDQMREVRWKQISMIFQGAMNALNPVFRIRDQLVEALQAHEDVSRQEALARAEKLFELVGIPRSRIGEYPHEMSGGMRQRAIIAMSLMCNPRLIIADEPTTALDVVVQDQILYRIKSLQQELGLGLILISHDILVVSEICDAVAVMYGGKIVEQGPVDAVFRNPAHPYTLALLRSCPSIRGPLRSLVSLAGTPPSLLNPPPGCRFAPRCPFAEEICLAPDTPLVEVQPGHSSLCHFAGRTDPADTRSFALAQFAEPRATEAQTVVRVQNLRKLFPVRTGLVASMLGRSKKFVHAVDGIDLEIHRGEVLGLAGESGCGKTTTGMMLSLLETPSEGELTFDGTDLFTLKKDRLKQFRRLVQPIFQDPYESLNPRFRVFDIICEPLVVHGIGETAAERRRLVFEMLELVGLRPPGDFALKFPHQLSGGQRQRVAIARAMIVRPQLVIADEPVSMLDASVRAGIMRLMLDLRRELGVTYLFITHDLATARYMCDRIAIMYLGRIVEIGPTDMLIARPQHPYTQILLSAVPVGFYGQRDSRPEISGDPPNPISIPPGCRFHPRCPKAMEICSHEEPLLTRIGVDHVAWCHLRSREDLVVS